MLILAQVTDAAAPSSAADPLLLSLFLAGRLTVSLVFFGWIIRNIMRSGTRVETGTLGVFEAVVAAAWLGLFALLSIGSAGHSDAVPDRAIALTTDQLISLAGYQIGIYAIPLALLIHRRHDLSLLFGLNSVSLAAALAWALASLFAFIPIMEVLTAVIQKFYTTEPPEQEIMQLMRATSGLGQTFVLVFFAVVLAPLCEEFFFRGLLYGAAKRYLGFPGAAILSAVAFGFVHMHLPAFLPLTALGLVLVLLYERTGSLIAPMTLHAVFNGATLVASRFIPAP
jgi:membrane protease YdiL (CAAX protease family)